MWQFRGEIIIQQLLDACSKGYNTLTQEERDFLIILVIITMNAVVFGSVVVV